MKPTKIYNQFDIVVVPFPFTDINSSKRRPAIVLSHDNNFNNSVKHSVMAMITSSLNSPWPLDVSIYNLNSTGLIKPSIIRMKFFTLDNKLIIRKIGNLSKDDQINLIKAINQLFNTK